MPHYLSKSRVLNGLQCPKLLWWRTREPDAEELVPDAALQAVFDRGNVVGEVAQTYVPGGVLIDRDTHGIRGALEATQAALTQGAAVIYEAAFSAGGVFAAVDILERVDEGWNLIEVKSATRVKDVHRTDVAVQMHVLEQAGLDVARGEVMVLNRDCIHPDLSNLFTRHDVTAELEELRAALPADIRRLQEVLAGDLPEVVTGDHCRDPYECPFLERCWPALPEHHVSTLYYARKRARELEEAGCATLFDIPDATSLSTVQARQVRAVREGRVVCEEGLSAALADLPEPVGYLDFETVNPAIPCWVGCSPYDQVPAQFVCYVRDGTGEPQLREWLPEAPGDPRPELARRLVDACRDAEVLLAWHASFEVRCVRLLAEAVPELADPLDDLAHRIVDLLPIVRDHVYHPDFGGSFSLKAVLPALVPELSYADLEIQDGATASRVLEALVMGDAALSPEDRRKAEAALRAYCRLDTWGMVKMHERLVALAAAP